MRIAVIGSGISGLASAYLLHPHADVHIFERHEVGIAPLTSKIAISESDEDMRNARMKPLSLNRVENLNDWILLQIITRANFHF